MLLYLSGNSDILSQCLLFVNNFFHLFYHLFTVCFFSILLYQKSGESTPFPAVGSPLSHLILFLIFLDCRLIQVISLGIDHDDHRKIFYFQFPDCLSSKIIVGNDLRLFDALGQ